MIQNMIWKKRVNHDGTNGIANRAGMTNRTGEAVRTAAPFRPVVCVLLLLLITAAVSHAQGFMVNPMRIDVSGRAGQTLRVPLELRNTAGNRNQILEVRPTHLGQTQRGQWGVTSEDPGLPAGLEVSARDWIEVPQNQININPLEREEVDLLIRIPFDARGTYVAGLLVDSPPPPGQTGISVRMRFIIPVIVEIQGRPVRQQVSVSDVSMDFETRGDSKSTYVRLDVLNEGRTFPRVRGSVQVEILSEERWRPVTRVDFRELGIVPGVKLELSNDLERRLPSGTYRLRADMQVDGRRTPPFVREIAFEGDPDADLLAFDRTLSLSPDMLTLDVSPGSTRTSIITVTNPSDDSISVNASALTPDALKGVVMQGLVGEELSAAPWIQIRPSEFTLRPNGRQSVRVVSQVPRENVEQAHYYAILHLETRYLDGQSAGETSSTAHLVNVAVQSDPKAVIERVSLTNLDDEGNKYAISGRFVNIGNVHLEPVMTARVLDGRGSERTQASLTGDSGYLLPMGTRDFGGELDFSRLDDGFYALRLSARFAGDHNETLQYNLEVDRAADGTRRVQLHERTDAESLPGDGADAEAVGSR